jgi:uncharacterized protein YyaL (SSP411 family)
MDSDVLDRNRLSGETSPYLLQHKDNPVHWQPWSPDTLAAAKSLNRPILLSVGYAACHWCHVMAHESFENEQIAAAMNERFVNIKVDREERPDIDAIYQHALHLLGEQGGWPLTMFLTPDGEPYWGGTYFPPTGRWGRPGFPDVLAALSDVFHKDPARVAQNVEALREPLQRLGRPQAGGEINPAILDQVALQLTRMVDPFFGGIGEAPKFPNVSALELIWRGWKRMAQPPMRDAVTRTLDHVCQGGIYDHLGGGFARYSVDQRWLVPHFEKMLYDNAQLIELLTSVWQETRSPLYEQRVAETVGWLVREMRHPEGGFYSSLDADSEGVEGKFYVWSEAEIDGLLGGDAELFKSFYDVSAHGNWEEKTILNRLRRMELADEATEARLAACRDILLRERGQRIRPGLDDKVLADWNGLTIAALAFAAQVFARPDWLQFARDAFVFVGRDMAAPDGRLRHSWRDGTARHAAILDDYADLGRAALALHEATGDASYLAQAERWISTLDAHYADPAGGGYYLAADDTEGLITRVKTASDSAVPSGNGTLVGVLARLHYLTGQDAYRQKAERIVTAFSGELSRNFFPLATLLNGSELLQKALQIVIRGERSEPATADLLGAVQGVSLPNRVLSVVDDRATLPANHPAAGKERVGGRPAAYVCEGPTCSLPHTDAAALAEDLRQRR